MTESAEAPAGPGRPTTYTQKAADEIVRRLSAGETLTDICADDHMPATRTVSDWKAAHPDFSADFGRARDAGYDAIASRARKTARGQNEDAGGDSSGDVQRDKLIIETDLKLLAKWDPRRYGDKVAHVGGGPDDAPIRYADLSEDELDARIAALAAKHGTQRSDG